jgi:peptidoglycan/LPS O-acetylase OafA/YrhL
MQFAGVAASYMRTRLNKFDVSDTLTLKGIAIACIVLHNFYHLLGPVKENEFEFDPGRLTIFLQAMQDPRQVIQAFFSFFGHYGVQIFIFLSAYGLALRYWDRPQSWGDFMWSRIKKIYPAFLLALVTWVVFRGMTNPSAMIHYNFGKVALTVLGIRSLVPGAGLPSVGPWWFLPFIMQFYALWPALKRFTKRFGPPGLIVLICASVVLLYLVNDILVARWSINLKEMPIGNMASICLGILAARYRWLPGTAFGLIGAALLVGGNAYHALWPLSFGGALLFALWLYRIAAPWLRNRAALTYLGVISMPLFFVNGFVRMPFFAIAQQNDWVYQLTLGFCSMGLSILVAQLLQNTEQMLRSAFRPSESLERVS